MHQASAQISHVGLVAVALAGIGILFLIARLFSHEKGRTAAAILVTLLVSLFMVGGLVYLSRSHTERAGGSDWRESAPGVYLEQEGDEMALNVGGQVHVQREGDETVVSIGGKNGVRIEQEGDETLLSVGGANGLRMAHCAPGTRTEKGPANSAKAESGPAAENGGPEDSESDRASDSSHEEPLAKKEPSGEPSALNPAGERPEWVDAEPRKVDNVYQVPVVVGPYETRSECDHYLPAQLQIAVDAYVESYLGHNARGRVRLPLEHVRRNLVKAEWQEPKDVLITPEGKPPEYVTMTRLHVLLEFDHETNMLIDRQWQQALANRRLAGVGGLMAAVLLLLSAVYAYLKIDLVTKGAYRGRLRLAAAGLILAVIAVGLAVLS